jgi:hypothetical protein
MTVGMVMLGTGNSPSNHKSLQVWEISTRWLSAVGGAHQKQRIFTHGGCALGRKVEFKRLD